MRVTTGLARGRTLVAPQGMDTRPSSDMTKQVLTVLDIIAMAMTTMVTILRATMLRVN